VLDLAASGAGQVAAEQRLKHEHERISLTSGQLLAQNVGGHCPHLGYGNCHRPSGRIPSMIPDFGCCGRWSLVVSGLRTTHTVIGEPQLSEHAPFRSEAASYWFATGGTPPLAIGIIELQAKTPKIFDFKGLIVKISELCL